VGLKLSRSGGVLISSRDCTAAVAENGDDVQTNNRKRMIDDVGRGEVTRLKAETAERTRRSKSSKMSWLGLKAKVLDCMDVTLEVGEMESG